MVSFSPNWAAIASVLGSAIAAPRGQWAQGAQMGAQNYQGMQDAQIRRQLQEQSLQLAQEEAEARRAENQRKTETEAQWKAGLPKLFGGEVQAPANGMSQAQFGGAPTEQTPGLFSDLDPTRKALLQQALQYASPGEGAGLLLDYAMKEPDEGKWQITDALEGNQKVTYRINLNTGERQEIGRGPAYAPQQPQQPYSTNLITLVGPDGKSTRSVDSRDIPTINGLIGQGWVERQTSMFPAAPNAYTYGPPDENGRPTLIPMTGGPADPNRQTDTQKNEYNKQSLALNNLDAAITRYESLIDKYGTLETSAEGRAELNNAYADLKIQMKEAANLGALTGPDVGVLQDMIVEPNSFSGAWTGTGGTKAQIAQMRQQVQQKRANLDAIYGPNRSKDGDAPPPPPGFVPLGQ